MACENCIEKIKSQNAENQKVIDLAIDLAKKHSEVFCIYTNEYGEKCAIRAADSTGYPIEQYITPRYQVAKV